MPDAFLSVGDTVMNNRVPTTMGLTLSLMKTNNKKKNNYVHQMVLSA